MTEAVAAKPQVLVITGPTGTGKSQLAVDLIDALAPCMPAEVISVDSAQVYRGLDLGTAKPELGVRARIPHHLIDIRDVTERYSAGDFAGDARNIIDDCHARGRLPILVGGTLLYLRALHDGLAALPPANAAVRAAIDEQAKRLGWPQLHQNLTLIDPAAAARIAPADAQRIQRALEVYELSGKTISELQKNTKGTADVYDWLRVALLPASRDELRARLAQRFDAMLAAGLLDEVRGLHRRGDLNPGLPAIRAVGYRQLWDHLDGSCSLAQARELAIHATAQLARRQMTWLRQEPGIRTIVMPSDQATYKLLIEELIRPLRVRQGGC